MDRTATTNDTAAADRASAMLARAAAALALLLGIAVAAPGAEAAGLCVAQNANSTIFVPHFRAPAKGKCKPYTGLVANGEPASGASGQACTTPDGSQVLLGLTAFIDHYPHFFEAKLPLPIGTPGVILRRTSIGSYDSYGTTAWLCSAP